MEKVWLKNYPKDIPAEIDTSRYNSIMDIFDEACQKYKNETCYLNFEAPLSYTDMDKKAENFASFLQNQWGIKKGDRIGIMLPNLLQYPVVMFGAMKIGCVVVNINPLYRPHELVHILNDANVKALVILENFKKTLNETMPQTKLDKIITTEIGDFFPAIKRVVTNFIVRRIKHMVPKGKIAGAYRLNDAIKKGARHHLKKCTLQQDDVAYLQYTGGTTGVAKGAILTHGNIIANVLQMEAWLKPVTDKITGKQIIFSPLPLYHIFSLTVNCIFYLTQNALNILITNPRDIKALIKTMQKHPLTAITGVNTLYNALLYAEDIKKVDFSHLALSIGGGMAVQKAVAEKWQEVTGCTLIEGYGLTETSPVITCNPLTNKKYTGSVGLPVPSTDISIRDENENELKIGEVGELCVKGPQVMRGYWQRSDLTEHPLTADGWFRTGDVARVDERGYVYIVDRIKDMINVSGFNVYPNEIEDVLAHHPGILESAVIGIPDEHSGEVPKAFIIRKDPNLTEKQVIDYCHDNLTSYKVPKQVEFRDELPKTNVGKILRRSLRK